MTFQARNEPIRRYRQEYRRASRSEKTGILNIIVESTGYNRNYTIGLLGKPPAPRNQLTRKRE